MEKLLNLVRNLEEMLPHHTTQNPVVSGADIDWHIEHCLMVLNGSCKLLQKSDPKEYKWQFNLNKIIIYLLGRIPRGKGKAPKQVQPTEAFEIGKIKSLIQKTEMNLNLVANLLERHFMKHPYFGNLNKKDALKFMCLHTEHHLSIIREGAISP